MARRLLIAAVILIGLALFKIFPGNSKPVENKAVETKFDHSQPVFWAKEKSVSKPWEYSQSQDDLSGKKYPLAVIKSDRSLALPYPYDGENYGTLWVRSHPKHGLDVIVSIEKGQILCRGSEYRRCQFGIRFDDEAPEGFTAWQAADGSSNIVFAAYPEWAIKKLRKAKKITVELLMFKAGNQVLTFTAEEPLKW